MAQRVLIDMNSVGHAAHRSTPLKSGDQETQAIYGTIKTLRSICIRHPKATVLGLWDGKSWRKEVSTVYKQNREDTADKIADRQRYKTQTGYIRRAIRLLGVPQLFSINLEADDLAAELVRRYAPAGDQVHLISGDQDWIQLIAPGVTWEDHREETRKVNSASFKSWTGVDTPIQFVQLKALQGDTSDNLPGVGKIGEVNAKLLIDTWGRVEAFLADPDPSATFFLKHSKKLPKCFADFHANVDGKHEKFAHNMQMMNLLGDHIPAPQKMTLSKGVLDPQGFQTLCHELAFHSITNGGHFETFIAPFQRTTH